MKPTQSLTKLELGDAIGILGLWLWLTIAVGPWQLGVCWFVVVAVLNLVAQLIRGRDENQTQQ